MNPLALQDLDNEVLKEADQYLRDHKILELFEVSYSFISLVQNHLNYSNTLMTIVCFKNGGYLRFEHRTWRLCFVTSSQTTWRHSWSSRLKSVSSMAAARSCTLIQSYRTSLRSTTWRGRVRSRRTNVARVSAVVDDFVLALKTLANSEFHFTKAQEAVIPSKVDLFTFMKTCDEILGIKPKWKKDWNIRKQTQA